MDITYFSRKIEKAMRENISFTRHFFSLDKSCLKSWSFFKEELSRQDFNQTEEQELLEKDKETFLFFERVLSLHKSTFEASSSNTKKPGTQSIRASLHLNLH